MNQPRRIKVCKQGRKAPGVKALQEIRWFQSTTDYLIPKQTFCDLVKEITQNLKRNSAMKFQSEAVDALQEAAESFLVSFFEQTNSACVHAKVSILTAFRVGN